MSRKSTLAKMPKALRTYWRGKVRCPACGSDLTEVPYHIDHIHPRSKGGGDEAANLQLLCAKCNLDKRAKLMKDWAPWMLDAKGNVRRWTDLLTPAEIRANGVPPPEPEPERYIVAGDAVRVVIGKFIGIVGTVKHRYRERLKVTVEGHEKLLYLRLDQVRFAPPNELNPLK
jgi:hypothetical protein